MSEPNWSRVFVPLLLMLVGITQPATGDEVAFERVFQTEATVRQSKSQEMRRQLNLQAKACSDFYDHACGNWDTNATPQAKLQHRIDRELLRLIEEAPHGKDSALARQAKEFFASCIMTKSQPQHSIQQQQFLSEFIQQNGGFPAVPGSNWPIYNAAYDWLQVTAGLRRHYGMDILIGMRVGYNYAQVQENSVYLTEPSTLFPRELCTRRRLGTRDAAYVAIEQLVAAQLRAWLTLDNEKSQRVAEEIVSFEHELCAGMQDPPQVWNAEEQLYRRNCTRKSLIELSQAYGIDFDAYMSTSFSQNIFRPVYMAAPDYYRQLKRTLDAHNSSRVANYVMYRALATLTFPLDDNPVERPDYCLAKIKQLLPSALGELYARQYASEEGSQQLKLLFAQLQAALKQSLDAEWLEEGSRRTAQRKLSDLQLELPSYGQQLMLLVQLERKNYWSNLRQLLQAVQSKQLNRLFEEGLPLPADPVEAYETRIVYRPVQRRLELGWALLQPPEHDARYGNALSYATLGSALAEHMAMAFDAVHWSVGLLEHDSWDKLTAFRYHNRSECFERQVEEYLRFNQTAARQQIAASAGLKIAFRAYLNWLAFQEPNNDFTRLSKETLPGLNYSNTALFFLAYAQQRCQPREQQQQEQHELPEPWASIRYRFSVRQRHSWTRWQVNGPLRNLPDFASDFHCAPGMPMNPAEKCVIY
ncbi:hypothetical protein KR222_005220 [Zaprionus bogoriensis]|nr:hypothetical protein KR222_005220 [Zaprionus bogoriensis]